MKESKNTKLNIRTIQRIYQSKFMSLVVAFLCLIITLVIWNLTRISSLENLEENLDSVSEVYANRVINRIDYIEFNLNELAGYGRPISEKEQRSWDMRTDFYLENLDGVKNVIYVDNDLIIQRVNSFDNEYYVVGDSIIDEKYDSSLNSLMFPIYEEQVFMGFIFSDIDVTELILSINYESQPDYMVQIFKDDTLLVSSDNWDESTIGIFDSNDITIKNETFNYILAPTLDTVNNSMRSARSFLLFGIAFSIIISYIWYSRTVINDRLEKLVSKKTSELSHMSYHDQLTGLYNRRFYEMKVDEFERDKVHPFSIILADINGLKLVNDAFGHQEGDILLKLASKLMEMHTQEKGIVCRIGGDEFAVLLPNIDAKESEKIVSTIESHSTEMKKDNIQLSISFGVASKEKEDSLSELFRIAEDRMYQSKLIEVPSMRSNAIDTIMQTLNEKDNYSEQHVRNVSTLSKKLAECMKLPISDIREIHTAGLLHDIGKIIIPTTILNKKGKLNDEEYTIMKSHPEIGFRILNSSSELRSISKVVLHHHERMDGKGYPQKLVGDEIPLKSRIISVVDAFDAMTTYRTYQKTLTKEEALEELNRCSGTQFDSNIVKIFNENFKDIVSVI